MAKFIQKGDNVDFKNTAENTINYGDVVVFGKTIGIANCSIQTGITGSIALTGVYEMPCEAVEAAPGDLLYWDNENARLTKTDTSGIIAGTCIEAKEPALKAAKVRL